MRPVWRMLRDGTKASAAHFSVEEAVIRGVSEGTSSDTLRLRECRPSVWIGLNQNAKEEADIDFCARKGIEVMRRHNPGGAVYQDEGSAVFSLIFSKFETFKRLGITEEHALYEKVNQAVVESLVDLGVLPTATGRNDVVVGERKVFGSAQLELHGAFCHSGSLLVGTDLDAMSKALTPSKMKFDGKTCSDVRGRVTSVSEALGKRMTRNDAFTVLIPRLAEAMGVEFEPGSLSGSEVETAGYLEREKYGRKEWTYPGERMWMVTKSMKTSEGIVTVLADFDGEKVLRIDLKGDFLLSNQISLDHYVNAVCGKTVSEAISMANSFGLPAGLKEAVVRTFTSYELNKAEER